ncbi:MAG: ABC-2 family transporter protein [Thermoanaerobaculia bacterium]
MRLKRAALFVGVSISRTLRADLSFFADTAVGLVCMLVVHGLQISAFWLLLRQLSPGSLVPYLGQQGAMIVAWGALGVGFDGLRRLSLAIENGEIESFLATPLPPLLVASASASSVVALADVFFGLVLLGLTAWFDPVLALLGLACVPMAFFTFAALFTLGAAASLLMRRGGALSDFLVFTTFTLSSLPSAAAFQGKARLLLYLCPALFTAYLPYESLASASGWALPLGTGASMALLWLSSRLFTHALGRAEFSSVARLRR